MKAKVLVPVFALVLAAAAGCSDEFIDPDVTTDASQDGFVQDTTGMDLPGTDGSTDRDTAGTDLAGTDTTGTDLTGVDINGMDINGLDLVGIDIAGDDVQFTDTDQQDIDQPDDTIQGDSGGDTYVPPTECGNPAIPEPGDGACSFTDGSNYLLLRGDVFGPENILRNAMVLIDPTGFIACADCDCSDVTGYDGATVIACPHALITPGLINGHDHVTYDGNTPKAHTVKYDHRHEWRTGSVSGKPKISVPQTSGAEEWSELRHVVGGATSMFGSGHGTGLLRNLDQELIDIPDTYKAKYDTFPLDDTSGTMLTSGCDYPGITQWSSVSGFKAYVPHISEGINAAANNEFKCLSTTDNGGQDLIRENSGIIHGIGLTAADIAQMAVDGTGLIWSVRTNIDLYGNTASVTLYDRLGVEIGLGPDWTASGSMNMLRELNCVDYLNRNHFNHYFTDRRIVELATAGNARVFNIDDKIGLLEPGLLADIAIFSTAVHPDERALIDGTPGDVLLTMRSGIPLYGDANLVDGLLPGDTGCESIDVCSVAKKVCVKRETGVALATMQSQATSWYGLFFCGVPANEPSCKPSRPTEYDGVTATDDDGDGEPDGTDNCPMVFNPIRPMDGGAQPDADGDDVGDACDPCPFDADTTACTGFDPDDTDGDGYPNDLDNCPREPNDDQADRDHDGKGDVCDQCPDDANPGAEACPATIYDIKTGEIAPGRVVKLSDVTVTAVAKNGTSLTGFFVQVDPLAEYYDGPDFSGIYVYAKGLTPIPAVGDVVSFTGNVTLFWGQLEMTDITGLVKSGTAVPPDPVLVTPAEVATGGASCSAMEAVLVEVRDVAVTDINPPLGGGDKAPQNEFVVDGGVRVNDFMYLISPFPVVDDMFESIVGVLRLANDNYKIEPRSGADVMAVTPVLALKEVVPAQAWFPWGDVASLSVPSLTVVLNRAVQEGESGQFLVLTSAPTDLFASDAVTAVAVGDNYAEILFDSGTAGSTLTDVDVCVDFGGDQMCSVVTLVPPSAAPALVAIEPSGIVNLAVGIPRTFEVTLDMPVFADGTELTVTIDDETVIPAPAAIPVPWGTMTAQFTVTPLKAGEVTIQAHYGTSAIAAAAHVTDAPQTSDVKVVEVFYDHSSTDSGYEWIKLYNAGSAAQDLSTWSLANAGTSWTVAKWNLSGSIPAGGCLVVGGPTADAENGNPTYDIILDFDPDLQNSGAANEAADGVAVFDVPAAAITADSIPVDVVIYGGVNSSGLVGPDGNLAPVDVADAPSGSSIARNGDGAWVIRADPTPGVCPPW